ncbi:ribonuclease R [Candidatus Photodesmus anomalopis]|uniref:Ribonuclease R n=1 Tax=Candidatus Photodesmus katoptron Akat1 TaxID=1236703 RepID=S3DHQ1_9GAMM|nr:ribonuclease R [Candidatus Photodesmus katoptron]EPE37210.1 ribonuclease R [Candidatus Photodesmus katoptron Akat1]
MNNDPFLFRESKKYKNPIPSREFILAYLDKLQTPIDHNSLFKELNLSRKEHYKALRLRLRAMERDGQLILINRYHYALPYKCETMKGFVIGHRHGYGWFRPEGQISNHIDVFLPHHQMRTIIHGDYVLVRSFCAYKNARKEGRVLQLLKQCKDQIVGRLFFKNNTKYVLANDSRINRDILIPDDDSSNAQVGNIVVVEIINRNEHCAKGIIGKIIEVLGESMLPGIAIKVALLTHKIPNIWPDNVEKEISNFLNFSGKISEKSKKGRLDLRDLPFITIDDEDAHDFDDAVFCKARKNGGWRLWVAVADVSYYVHPNSYIDKEAINRGNSVYLPSRVIPMLPEVLSNGLCSLKPKVDRLCLICEISISDMGKLLDYKHYEAIISSHKRFTYNEVSAILNGDKVLRILYNPFIRHLEELHKMYKVLKNARNHRGSIEFDVFATKIIFSCRYKIDRIEPIIRNDAHKIVEECMILANIASALLLEKSKIPVLFRIHDSPDNINLKELRIFLDRLGLNLTGGLKPSSKDYANLISKIANHKNKELIQSVLLRSMKQAVYSSNNTGHFGLGLKVYVHVTSPIRRYSDLVLHRLIKYILSQENNTLTNSYYRYSSSDINFYSAQCSMTERRADNVNRMVSDWFKSEYIKDYIGEEFNGIIIHITHFGFFVRLDELYIDGLVHISCLTNDCYKFNLLNQSLIGKNFGINYRLGDIVKVKILSIDSEHSKITLKLVKGK